MGEKFEEFMNQIWASYKVEPFENFVVTLSKHTAWALGSSAKFGTNRYIPVSQNISKNIQKYAGLVWQQKQPKTYKLKA